MRSSVSRSILLWLANLLGIAAFTWPFLLPAAIGEQEAHELDAPWILGGLVVCVGALLFVELGRGGLGPKAVALIGVLGAAMVVLRLPGSIGGFSPLFLIVLVAGNAFGPGFGFVLGACGLLASALFVGGFGPWVPFQMVAVGWVGMGAGVLPRSGSWRTRIVVLAVYGFLSGYLFGAIMNLWSWPYIAGGSAIGWDATAGYGANLVSYGRFYLLTSFAWDTFRAVGNVAMILLLGRPVLGALDRAARRMDLTIEPIRSVREGVV